jgi:hypothetical protein
VGPDASRKCLEMPTRKETLRSKRECNARVSASLDILKDGGAKREISSVTDVVVDSVDGVDDDDDVDEDEETTVRGGEGGGKGDVIALVVETDGAVVVEIDVACCPDASAASVSTGT